MEKKPALSPLYARYLSLAEQQAICAVPIDNLSSEINLVRVLTGLLMKFQRSAPPDFSARIHTLRTCVFLAQQLAYLVHSYDRGHNSFEELEQAIQEALASMSEDWSNA